MQRKLILQHFSCWSAHVLTLSLMLCSCRWTVTTTSGSSRGSRRTSSLCVEQMPTTRTAARTKYKRWVWSPRDVVWLNASGASSRPVTYLMLWLGFPRKGDANVNSYTCQFNKPLIDDIQIFPGSFDWLHNVGSILVSCRPVELHKDSN